MALPYPHLLIDQEGEETILPLVNASFWTLGRGDNNDVVLKDKWSSRNHAVIQSMETGTFFLIDLGSMNGSFVNGKRVSIPVSLSNGNEITLGTTKMILVCPGKDNGDIDPTALFRKGENSTVMLQKKRLITVLVIDIRNYTKLTQMLDEQTLSLVIGNWFSEAWTILQKYGSGADKFIGDAIMAVWVHEGGEDTQSSKEVLQVLRALYELYSMSDDLNNKYTLPFRLRIGAGVNTGQAIVGQMSAGGRPEYTAIGDSVNAAFRLESATKELGLDVAIGLDTYEHVPRANLLNFQRHSVPAKNYDHPLPAFAGEFKDLAEYITSMDRLNQYLSAP